jgi:L-threonylcarbamoyladenylate synthase
MDLKRQYRKALDVLRDGGIVALPTDTVYGLVAVAANDAAVERVYATKVRDPAQPMPLFVGSLEQAGLVGEMNDAACQLAEHFWPGALTIVVPRRARFETRAAAGGHTVGLRMPDDPFLREAAAQLGPLTGTSANIAGAPECRSADEVRAQLGDSVDLIVEGTIAATAAPSTIVDATSAGAVRILREGDVSRADLESRLAGVASVA